MALFIQKEAARLIAVNKHDFDLVRKGHTLEISKLKEEIKDLSLRVQPDFAQPLTPTQLKTYGEKIRGLNTHVEDLKKKLSAVLSVNQRLEAREKDSNGPPAPDSQALSAQITVLTATVESQTTQYQSALDELSSDHDCLTAELRSERDSLQAQLDNANVTLQNRSAELSQLQDTHNAEMARVRHSTSDQAATDAHELTSLRAEVQDFRSRTSNDLINDLRSELSIQFGVSSTLRSQLADSKSDLDKVEIDLDHLRSDFAHCDHQYSATKAELEACRDDLALSATAAAQTGDVLSLNAAHIKDLQDELSHVKNRLQSVTKENESVYAQHEDQRQVIATLRVDLREANDTVNLLQKDGSPSILGPLTTSNVQCQTLLQGLPSCETATQTTRRELNDRMGSMDITPDSETSAPPTPAEVSSVDLPPMDVPGDIPPTHGSERPIMPPPQSVSVSWADSSDREALDPPSFIPPTDQLPLPPAPEAPQVQAMGTSSSSVSDISNEPAPPHVHARHTRSPEIANNYNWFPPANPCYMKPKFSEKPWALFLGDSMFQKMDTANIVSGSSNSRQFHPHTEAVAWECETLVPTLAGYNQPSTEGVGIDIIILSVGTNDAAQIQKFGGIQPGIDLDRLVHIRIEQWPAQIMDMYRGLMSCLDPYGKVLFLLPIGIASVSNHDTGIWYFRQLAIHFAKQFPRIFIIDNSNMIRNNRAIPSMIRSSSDPHFSERGRNQAVANIKAAMRIALPALAAYSIAVNDHIVKRRQDPHRPAPHAQFLRRGSAHTGIPDPDPPEESTPVRKSRAPESTPSTSSDTAPVSVGSIVRQCGLDTTYTSYATVAGQGARPSAEASTGCPPPSGSNDRASNTPSPAIGDSVPQTKSTTSMAPPHVQAGNYQGARPKEPTTSVGLPQRPSSVQTHSRPSSESLTQITRRTLESEAAQLPPQGAANRLSPSPAAPTASQVAVPPPSSPVSEGAPGGTRPPSRSDGSSQPSSVRATTSEVPSNTVPATTQVTITPEMFEHFLRAPDSFYRMVGAASKGSPGQDIPKAPQ